MQGRKVSNNNQPQKNKPSTPLGTPSAQKTVVAIFLIVALVSFEIFNFDTTRFALSSLLGDVRFLWVSWAAILAIAFCAIDFAGLIRIFTPERGKDEPKAVWYLTGAWLLGATLNAVMTWWAVSLTLLSHDFGNEVLSREQLLYWVPLFVAVFVWLTRILFIGAMSVAGDYIFDFSNWSIAKSNGTPQKRPYPQQTPLAPPTAQPMRASSANPQYTQSPPRPPQPTTQRKPTPIQARPRR